MNSIDREYFLIRNNDDEPIGRFYIRKWIFNSKSCLVDWELNIFIAKESERGKGYGTEVQKLAVKILQERSETNSIFAYTMNENIAERRVLEKCGFEYIRNLSDSYYAIGLGTLNLENFVMYVLK